MRISLVFVAMAGTMLLSGCGAAIVSSLDGGATPQAAKVSAHVVSGAASGDTIGNTVSDRTSAGVDSTATIYMAKVPFSGLEVPTSAELAFNGKMDSGATIPNTGRMQAPSSLADKAIAGGDLTADLETVKYSDGDSFLQRVDDGNGFVALRYEAKQGDTVFHGYVVGGVRTDASKMPTTGTATFNGEAHGTWFASSSGKGTAKGDSQVIAAFAPGGGTVNGTVKNITVDGVAQTGLQLNMAPTAINGNSYNGAASLTGAATSSGNYQGGFYSSDASGTAGTFHLRATGVATSAGIQDVEAVGSFGGNQ